MEAVVADTQTKEQQGLPQIPIITENGAEIQLRNTAALEQLSMSTSVQDESIPSSDSEEEIVFHGRCNGIISIQNAPSTPNDATSSAATKQTKSEQDILSIPIRHPPGALDDKHLASSADVTPACGKRRIINSFKQEETATTHGRRRGRSHNARLHCQYGDGRWRRRL